MRIVTMVAVALLTTGGLVAAESARASITQYELNIPRQTLDTALNDLAQQTGLQVGRFSDAVKGDTVVGPIAGTYSAEKALESLLANTRLTYRTLNDRAIIVLRLEDVAQLPAAKTLSDNSSFPVTGEQENAPLRNRLRLAQTTQGSNQSTNSVNTPSFSNNSSEELLAQQSHVSLEEVVVTAQKREEKLQDVPVPVTVINGQALLEQNQLRLQDYYSTVPGLSVTAGNSSSNPGSISIRGITSGPNTNPSVGIEIDDVPFGSSGQYGGGNLIPDIDPSDLARVEVLRGPQGTLYGASSLGGLIKFVTVDPSTDGISGRVEAGTSAVYSGAEPGYNFRGAINVPLTETLAVRASAFTRADPGYISDPVTHVDGTNEAFVSGGRLSAIWLPSQDFTLKLSSLYQKFNSNGINENENGFGDLQQNYLPGSGRSGGSIQAYSATLTGKVGGFTLTALSGYNVRQGRYTSDTSGDFEAITVPAYGTGGSVYLSEFNTRKFSQEIRASTPIGSSIDWLLGAFYTHEDSSQLQTITANEVPSGQIITTAYDAIIPSVYSEYAVFTNLTVHFTDKFDVQFGGRGSRIQQTFAAGTTYDPLFTGGDTTTDVGTTTRSSANPVTYLLTPSFKINPDLMLYARLASGYRPGGPNAALCTVENFPCQYSPDKTQNYEVGAKGDFLDHMFSFDASVYYIDWKHIQLAASAGDFGYEANASAAKSQGVELSVEARPLTGTTISAWVSYDDAVLTEGFPAVLTAYGAAGDRLPYTSRLSGSFSANQDFRISDRMTGFAGGTISYVGDRLGTFSGSAGAPAPRQNLPGYARTDLRTGVRYDGWTGNLFASNIFDRRGLIDGGADLTPATGTIFIQPRTVGISVSKAF